MGIFLLLFVMFFINEKFYNILYKKHSFFDVKLIRKLFLYHILFLIIYYLYSLFNASDSKEYFNLLSRLVIQWSDTIDMTNWGVFFIAYPFVKYFNFNYEMCMLLFSWFGFIGFLHAYLFFKENIRYRVKVFGKFDFLTLLLFLPNMHFWSVSFGKGSVIFMGIMMFVYSINFPKQRFITLILGVFFIYCIRPHILFFILVGVIFGLFFGRDRKMTVFLKFILLVSSILFLYLASNSILAVANLEKSQNVVDDFTEFALIRSEGLSKNASSGVDMNSYPLPAKFFTFWFRPLFVDSPNVLGIFSSFENLLYLILFFKVINKSFFRFIKKSPYIVKMSAMVFILTSFAMTFVMSNLGIIMRQKSQVMYFGFFVIYYFLALKEFNKSQKITQNENNLPLIPNL